MNGCKPVNMPAIEESKVLCTYHVQADYINTKTEVKKSQFSVTHRRDKRL